MSLSASSTLSYASSAKEVMIIGSSRSLISCSSVESFKQIIVSSAEIRGIILYDALLADGRTFLALSALQFTHTNQTVTRRYIEI